MSPWAADKKGCLQYCRHFLADNSVFHIERCMSIMQSGTQMVKLKNGSKGLVRLFYLDEHRTCIRWRPSRKNEKAKITIDSLYKVTEGRHSGNFHRHAEGNFDPSCCFTIYHGNHMESLDVVTSNPEEARTWITGLKYLMAGISDEDSLSKRQRTHNQWMKQTFEEADKNGDGLLNIEEIYQLLHKMNVNLPRRKVRQMFQEADTDEHQGTLTFEEFCVFYKMMSLRRDIFLLLMCFSDKKDHLTVEELAHFLKTEQKMSNVTTEYCLDVIDKFEVSEENKKKDVLGVEGFTLFMRSPACDIFNPLHHEVNQDMDQPLCNYFIASSHNTYLTGDQLLSHSKTDMYAWVLQSGCRCVEVDCWDGPDGEPVVHHGYTLTSKISFKDVIETINKYAFVKNEFPVILSIENHCSILQQKKIAQYLKEVLGEKLDLGGVLTRDSKQLPSPMSLKGKILIKGKRLPPFLAADAEEGEVSDDDSADEIEDDFKLKQGSSNEATEHHVESCIRKKLDSLLKESKIGDKEDSESFTIKALLKATHGGLHMNLKQNSNIKEGGKKSQSCSFISNFSKHKKNGRSRSKSQSIEGEEDGQHDASEKGWGLAHRAGQRRKTIKLSRELSELVVFTNSVASQDVLEEGSAGNVLSFSETRAHQLVNQKLEQFILFNQKQLSRIYPSAYRVDSSNFNPQAHWNIGCQLVALNYQTEGRMMQLNRAKFLVNGNTGYVLKPQPMCKGAFNPFSEDPLPAYPKKQLVLKIISGQQLPKPPDSMLGDRGEIIDPFVEVEIIGLPVDSCKEQTRVVDDNGFNPVWEETITFTLHMPELALVRFLVWDHDPIGRDFVGQRTVAFSSLMPGYRHVYLEGMTEASIFVQVLINDIYGKWSPLVLNPSYTILHFLGASKGRQLRGFKSLFSKNPKNCSVDTNSGFYIRKRSVSDHILRRTASAPAKGRKKNKMGFTEVSNNIKENEPDTLSLEPPGKRKTNTVLTRPLSMPVDKLLNGGLELPSCKPVNDPEEKGTELRRSTDTPGHVERIRSASIDVLIETQPSTQSDDETPTNTFYKYSPKKLPPSKALDTDKTSYLEIGGNDTEECLGAPLQNEITSTFAEESVTDDMVWHTFDICASKQKHPETKKDIQEACSPKRSAKPDIVLPNACNNSCTSISTVDLSSTICLDKTGSLSSNGTMQDSTISRLIDAVSLSNESGMGSISALISQFDTTDDKTNLTTISSIHRTNNHTFSLMSGFSNTLTLEPNSPQKPFLTNKKPKDSLLNSTTGTAVFSSPETTEHSMYTILNEEILSPASVYNLTERIIRRANLDSEESTPAGSSCCSPVKTLHPKQENNDSSWVPLETGRLCDRAASVHLQVSTESAGSSLMEVETDADDELQDFTLTSSKLNNLWPRQTASPYEGSPYGRPKNNGSYHDSYQLSEDLWTRSSNTYHCSYRMSDDMRTQKSNTYHRGYQLSEDSRTQNNGRCYDNDHLLEDIQASRKMTSSHENGYCTFNHNGEELSNVFHELVTPKAYHEGFPVSKRPVQRLHTHMEQSSEGLHIARHPSPCKSKSLGDLTSEDILCNFESKYKYISRSFVTPAMKDKTRMASLANRPQSADPLTEQLRKLVSFEQEERGPPTPVTQVKDDEEDSPKMLSRKLSSRSQSRVRHIANRARERQEASKQKLPNSCSTAGIVLRNKPPAQHPTVNRHSTGSYIAGYLNHINGAEMADRGLPEGACTSFRYRCHDSFYADDSDPGPTSEPEIYFLLRL
ncbi:1-phosphatidylinositol 4,5-bisphosphate phosphodiesterase eta-1-like isoform X1 [Polyodon spathula]|uniref:1-phosphatidylinositol 4,5-bisphosphate phosphodiesterase eta-1-like isoform X1 n=1 Tax=Polyodon spathula TaxID=7913 RepID=UPI001B7E8E34|nr:1-phosphatidylinositol 4,5-bisphosphate phosphodiesterase eta-1-like isoform X1 [Polyodon spathula]